MRITFCTGVSLRIIYGVLIHDFPIILTDVITLLLACAILLLKFKYG